MKQASTFVVIIFLTSLHLIQASFDAAVDRDCTYYSPCLTSFIWCDESGDNRGCTYPQDAYPLYDRKEPGNPAMLVSTHDYTISWKKANPNYPVRLEWLMPTSEERSRLLPRWDFSKSTMLWTLCRNAGDSVVRTEANVSDTTIPPPTSFLFKPDQILRDLYGDDRSNATEYLATLAIAAAGLSNIIRISQPERVLAENDTTPLAYTDFSSQFTIQSSLVPTYLDTQRSIIAGKYKRNIRLGVGIGVGLGVPFAMASTAVVTWLVCRQRFLNTRIK